MSWSHTALTRLCSKQNCHLTQKGHQAVPRSHCAENYGGTLGVSWSRTARVSTERLLYRGPWRHCAEN